MVQAKRFSWTNPSSAVARNLNCGFQVAHAITIDVTNGGSWEWINGMGDGYYLDVDSGSVTTSNGFTPLSQNAAFGATISAFSNANPGVITVNDTASFGFAAGDTIKVSSLSDDGTGTSLNGEFTVASVTATTITLDQNTSAYSAYVSGGYVSRVSDSDGNPIATNNEAIEGVTLGTGVVGGNSAVMVAICYSDESVV